ncbi:MAG: biotin--[acetyl-CoA-carboxylase] ligase, partial [Bacteroidales bacterium]|nr:biotin--[acetyl-CoA-carboxylase] ligase [Bacteroidales bacterium]
MPNDYIYLKETSSTQTYLKSLDVNALPEFYCVRTGFQQQGRGRGSNSWESLPDENLMMSVLLFPDTSPEKQFDISCMTALALVETIYQNTDIQ